MTMTQRLFSSPDTTPRSGGIVYTVQAVIEDIPLNTSLSFLQRIELLVLNDSEGILQFKGRNDMTGGWNFALLHPGKTPVQMNEYFRSIGLKHTMFGEENTVVASPSVRSFTRNRWYPILPESCSSSDC